MTIVPLDMDKVKELRMRGLYDEADTVLERYHESIERQREEDKKQARNIQYLKRKLKKNRDKPHRTPTTTR